MTATSMGSDKDIVITREFAAPRQLVWDVWTQPEHMEKWFGAKGEVPYPLTAETRRFLQMQVVPK